MKSTAFALFPLLVVAASLAHAGQLVPAGSLISCTLSDPTLSSKTASIGDPVLCAVSYSSYMQQVGPARLPYDSYLAGQFEEYKDPGHFVGKGWMELKFERVVIEPDTVIPISARVVGVTGYHVDRDGRILGRGHAVRDSVEWAVPILWPIDLINLPRRGPRPTIKNEARLVLKVMNDFKMPDAEAPQEVSPGLYRRTPSSYAAPPPPEQTMPSYPVVEYHPMTMPAPSWYGMATERQFSSPPEPGNGPGNSAFWHGRPPYVGSDGQDMVTLVFDDGRPPETIRNYVLTQNAIYVQDGYRQVIPIVDVNLPATVEVNRRMGVDFRLPGPAPYYPPAPMYGAYR